MRRRRLDLVAVLVGQRDGTADEIWPARVGADPDVFHHARLLPANDGFQTTGAMPRLRRGRLCRSRRSLAGGGGGGSSTSTTMESRSGTRRCWSGSARWPSRRPGRTSGSARIRCGHIQATGGDATGRKQYRYHDRWRERRDAEKYDAMLAFARSLPSLRAGRAPISAARELPRERVLACAVRLLDRGFFRVGGEDYAEENQSYGMATMRQRRHVAVDGERVRFDYEAKGGQRRVSRSGDRGDRGAGRPLRGGRGAASSCSRTSDGRAGGISRSEDVNGYVKGAIGRGAQGQGLPDLERNGARRHRPRAARARNVRHQGGRNRAIIGMPCTRWPGISATLRRSGAPPTSTRRASTASTAASPSVAC